MLYRIVRLIAVALLALAVVVPAVTYVPFRSRRCSAALPALPSESYPKR